MRKKTISLAYIQKNNDGVFISTEDYIGTIPYNVDINTFLLDEIKKKRNLFYGLKKTFNGRSDQQIVDTIRKNMKGEE